MDREFISTAVHDLREPLRAIRANSEALATMHGEPQNETASLRLRYVREGVERIESLIHDIAEYCYEEVRGFDPHYVNMQVVLLEVSQQLRRQIESSGAMVTNDPLPTVRGDFNGLASVLNQVIMNACKFCGERAPRIHVGVDRRGAEWIFCVRDNGPGFDPRYCELIFKPFERLDGRRYPGSGLGLTLAKRIIERHGGRMWAESKSGEGAVFWFTLPA